MRYKVCVCVTYKAQQDEIQRGDLGNIKCIKNGDYRKSNVIKEG